MKNVGDRRRPGYAVSVEIVMLAVVFLCGSANGEALRLSGYGKGFLTVQDPAAGQAEVVWWSPVRLNGFWRPNRTVSGSVAYELSARIRLDGRLTSDGVAPGPEPMAYRVEDLGTYLSGGPPERFALLQNLDRVFLTVSVPAGDFYVGRQAVAFGSARVVNPTDVVAPFVYEALDKEERVGVDAVRARFPVGAMSEVDVGALAGRDLSLREGAAFVRVKGYAYRTDAAVMGMVFREHVLLGLDLARAVGGAGAWLEAAWVHLREGNEGAYWRVSAGMDYSFGEATYGFLEYHFNGAGALAAGEYTALASPAAYTEAGVYLLGRHYAAPGVTYRVTPLLFARLQALVNLGDPSAFLSPGLEYSVAQNVSASAGVFYSLGQTPDSGGTPRSEFGLYPSIFYGSLRYYF